MSTLINCGKFRMPIPASLHKEQNESLPKLVLFSFSGCSHSCHYCIAKSALPGSNPDIKLLLNEIGWEAYLQLLLKLLVRPVEVAFAGYGESAEHAMFLPLVQGLLDAGHHVSILTHGRSSGIIAKTLEKYNRDFIRKKVSLIVSFHYGVYIEDATSKRLDSYMNKHFPKLAALGAKINLITPMTPRVLESANFPRLIEKIQEICAAAETDIIFDPYPLFGTCCGGQYPESYTDKEIAELTNLITKNQSKEYAFATKTSLRKIGSLHLKGIKCYGMMSTCAIDTKGDISLCQGTPSIPVGNIANTNMKFPIGDLQPLPCHYDTCGCTSRGAAQCLVPHNVSFDEYLKYTEKPPVPQAQTNAEDPMEKFILALINEKLQRALADFPEEKIGIFPFGKHSRWILKNLCNEIPASRIIFFDDSLSSETSINDFQCIPSAMAEKYNVKRGFLSSDIPSDAMRKRASEVFQQLMELYPSLPVPYIKQKLR